MAYEIYNFLVNFYHFFEEFLSPRTFPEWTGVCDVLKVSYLLSFSRLRHHSHYLNAEQHQDQVDLRRALTSSSQIATTAILLFFPPHEQHIQYNFDDVGPIRIKVHPPSPKTTFKHQSVDFVIELFFSD